MELSRRDFLAAAGLLGAGLILPGSNRWASATTAKLTAAELTTLGRTIKKGVRLGEGSVGVYYRLAEGPGEPHLRRTDLSPARSNGKGNGKQPLLSLVHLTDVHIIDAQSPARVEFLDRFADPGRGCESIPFASAYRPQELLTLHVFEAMIRRIRAIGVSPVTGCPFQVAVSTGDNVDNEQLNEIRWFIDLLDGGKRVSVNSGGPNYEGVQSPDWGDPEYWHPTPGVADKYKQQWGFPDYPGMLETATRPFEATGIGLPWLQTFGNHDGLLQGNAPRNPIFEGIAMGPAKFTAPPPGLNPCDSFQTLRDNPAAFLAAPTRQVAADADRRILTRAQYIEEMFRTTGTPAGHGFTAKNRESGVAYWHNDAYHGFRLIGLDTVNPGGFSEGSIGAAQLAWLEERLTEVSSTHLDATGEEVRTDNKDRLVILFSHHGLRSLENPLSAPDPFEPGSNDLPRVLADEVEALIHRFPNVIAWVNGHSHANIIVPRKSPTGKSGFWDIGTAAHIDWSCQSRLIDVVDNLDGTLSIFCTMVDHDAPIVPGDGDDVLRLASISRELAANDFQGGFVSTGPGKHEDRNVELLIRRPARIPHPKRLAPATVSA